MGQLLFVHATGFPIKMTDACTLCDLLCRQSVRERPSEPSVTSRLKKSRRTEIFGRKAPTEAARSRNTGKAMEQPARSQTKTNTAGKAGAAGTSGGSAAPARKGQEQESARLKPHGAGIREKPWDSPPEAGRRHEGPETQPGRPAPQGQAAGAPPPEPPDTHGKKPDNAARQGHAGWTPQARRRAEGKKNPRPRGEGNHENKKKSRQLPTFPRYGVSSA